MAREIETSIFIAAAPSKVWAVLMDFAAYPQWNPFIRKITGRPRAGERLEVIIQPPGMNAHTVKPTVIAFEVEKLFGWRGSLPVPGLFAGAHTFVLGEEGEGTRFDHGEVFHGLLVPFVAGVLKQSELGFREMNEALRKRAEG
jgi:hypothetical protein